MGIDMKDPNRLCLGCMSEWGHPRTPCPVCGFVEKKYEKPPRWLPLRHVLNGKYMIGKVIGEGGFGITYLGWDLNLQIRVAIKEYFPVGLATRETGRGNGYTISSLPGVRQENYRQGLEKFMTEAKNLSKFYNLQGIVAVKDFFFENETAYMVMEYIDGITLGKYLKNHGGQISEQEALQLFHPVIESLKVVHQSGIIHRDISPDNIMMTKDGRMKLIDFGAARFAGGDTERSLTIILKHGYAPAEQYQSHGNQGPWTDVYAICATMYRMITGKVPPSAMDRLHQDTLEEFEKLNCRVSTKTAYAVIDKGLAIRVEERYKNMDELLQGLYGIDQKKVHRKKKSKNQNQNRIIALAGGTAAVVCIGIAAAVLMIGGGNKVPTGSGQAGTVQTGDSQMGAVSETGQAGSGQSGSGSGNGAQNRADMLNNLKPVSAETLEQLQAEAFAAAGSISADAFHLVMLRDDGSVAGSGTNYYGNLDVNKWKKIKGIATGASHTVGIKTDGTAVATGDTSNGKCAVDTWKTIVKAAAGEEHTLGLKENGTVSAAGSNSNNQCDVSAWTDIVDIAAGERHSLGLKSDGTVIAVGADGSGQCQVADWSDIVQIEAKGNISAGLKSDGTVILTGDVSKQKEAALDWEQVIYIQLGEDYIAGLLSNKTVVIAGDGIVTQESVDDWRNIEVIAAGDETLFGKKTDGGIVRTTYSYGTITKEEMVGLQKAVTGGGYVAGLKKDGTVAVWGISGESFGQDEVAGWSGMIDIAASEDGILGLKEDGTVVVLGERYQEAWNWKDITRIAVGNDIAVGIKSDGNIVLAGEAVEDISSWSDLKDVAVSADGWNVAAIKSDGTVLSIRDSTNISGKVMSIAAASNHVAAALEDGTVVIGGYSNGGYSNVHSWRDVVQVAAGVEHTIGLKSDGTLLAAGSNSNGQCDVSEWTDVVYVTAGEYYTVGIQSDGTLLIAGKISGEY